MIKGIAIVLFCLISYIRATHLMGGQIEYEYLGAVGGGYYRYRITVKVYYNCDATSNVPVPQDPRYLFSALEVPGSSKPYYRLDTLPRIDTNLIVPELPSGCAVGANVCIREGIYIKEIDFPSTYNGQFVNGYHIWYVDFARNNSIVNLANPGNEGMGFYAFIPSPVVQNNSAKFNALPVPFLCSGDTVDVLNTAYDPDGDQLVFSFVDPYDGWDCFNDPAWGCYSSFQASGVPMPAQTVAWAPGYSLNQPFGSNGYAYINAFTGFTRYYNPNTGNFVVAVEVKEYRNGQLVGITRRDYQLIFLSCPSTPPNFSSVNGVPVPSNYTPSFTIEEGQQICFSLGFSDPNGDSLTITASGPILDPSIVTNPANTQPSIPHKVDSAGSVQFCWQTVCGEGRSAPYTLNVIATDNGCPPQTAATVPLIYVTPFDGANSINGPDNVCGNQTNTVYSVPLVSGASYNWAVQGGTIVAGQNTNSITVNWGNVNPGTVMLTITSQYGCADTPITKLVNIIVPYANAGSDKIICPGDTVQIGGNPSVISGFIFSWSPNIFINNAYAQNPLVYPPQTVNYILHVYTPDSLCSTTDTVLVSVAIPNVQTIPDTSICVGDTIQLYASGGTSYNWSPPNSLSNANIANPNAFPSVNTMYYVTVTNSYGCKGVDSVYVQVNPKPTPQTSNDTLICAGDTITIWAQGGISYLWSPSGFLSNPNDDTTLAFPSSNTTFYVTVKNAFNCYTIDSVVITTQPGPTVTAFKDTAICYGDTALLSASGALTYTWYPSSYASNPNNSSTLVFPPDTTAFIVVGEDANGCKGRDTVMVYIMPLPPIDGGGPYFICVDDTIQMIATGALTYTWTPSSHLSDPNNDTTLAWPPSTTTYYVEGTNTYGCKKTDTVLVVVASQITVNGGPDRFICFGDTIQLGGNPTAPSNVTIAWTPSTYLNDSTIQNPLAFPSNTTTFYVTVTSDTCKGYDTVVVNVMPLPNITKSSNITICVGDTGVIWAGGGVSYSWSPQGLIVNPNKDTVKVFPQDTTTFYVTVTDANGCSVIDSVIVYTYPLSSITTSPDTYICAGDTIQIAATGAIAYTWWPTTYISNTNINNPLVYPPSTTTYYVTGTDANGCKAKDSVVVSVVSPPVVTTIPDTSVCAGKSIMLYASGGTSYSWAPTSSLINPNSPNPIASPSSNTTYYVSVYNSYGCMSIDSVKVSVHFSNTIQAFKDTTICSGDTIQLIAYGGSSYIWSPSQYISNPTSQSTYAFPQQSTWIYVQGGDTTGCLSKDSVFISVNPIPLVSASSDKTICIGDTVLLTVSGATSYQWSPFNYLSSSTGSSVYAFPNTTTQFIVTGTDANGCTNTDTVVVYVVPKPFADAGPSSIVACKWTQIQLGGSPTGPPGASFIWQPSNFLNNPFSPNPIATISNMPITFYLTVTDPNGCKNTDSIKINPFKVNSSQDAQCPTTSQLTLSVSISNGSGLYAYSWEPNSLVDSPTSPNPIFIGTSSAVLTVVVKDLNLGCSDTANVAISVPNLPLNYLIYLSPSCEKIKLNVMAKTSPNNIIGIKLPDTSAAKTDSIFLQTDITYPSTINLQIYAEDIQTKCRIFIDTIISTGNLLDSIIVIQPNVITPNGDGLNDYLEFILGNHHLGECATLEIYDRWGVLIFKSQPPYYRWDGRNFSGEEVSPGVYYFILKMGSISKHGFIHLIR